MKLLEIKNFLDQKVLEYNQWHFLEEDPIQIPHQFSKKEDIEIAAFLTATISWGNRKMIVKNAKKMMELLDNAPHEFVVQHKEKDLQKLTKFVHRTFNEVDFQYFIYSLKNIYQKYNGLENVLKPNEKAPNYQNAIHQFKSIFFELPHLQRTEKHVSDPLKNSAAKRILMFLRWMVRKDTNGVDFGIWQTHKTTQLSCPLDVHSGSVARKLGILKRTQNDWKAVEELDKKLRKFDPNDPIKYDFALFGLGVFEKF